MQEAAAAKFSCLLRQYLCHQRRTGSNPQKLLPQHTLYSVRCSVYCVVVIAGLPVDWGSLRLLPQLLQLLLLL